MLLIGTLEITPISVNLHFSFEVDPSPVSLGSIFKSSPIQTIVWDNERSQHMLL